MCKYSSDKDLNRLIRTLVAGGWVYVRRSKHGQLTTPCGCWRTTVSISPSNVNAAKSLRWDIEAAAKQTKFLGKEKL
jgi:hypothetical protein